MNVLPLLATFLLLAGPAGESATGGVFWDRGHFWIEVVLPAGHGPAPADDPAAWIVTDCDGGEQFGPSGVRVSGEDPLVFLLSSRRIRGGRCYEVVARTAAGDSIRIGPFCDPFRDPPGDESPAPRRWFRRWVAPAFDRRGDPCRVDALACRYEFAGERRTVDIDIGPRIDTDWWTIAGELAWDATSWEGKTGRTPVDRRRLGLSIAGRRRAGPFLLAVEAAVRDERSVPAPADSARRGRVLRGLLLARFDRLFAGANRWGFSSLKGVDLAFGYARYREERGSGETAGTWEWRPLARFSFVWTFLYGFQLAYRIESWLPASAGERFEEYHSLRFRLLLRDALEKTPGSPWHPDLQLAFDDGGRPPFFERERRVSVGFVFDLFPF